MPVYHITDWNDHFENNRTRDLVKMAWVPIPNQMDGDGYTELVDHENGAAHLGAWLAIVEVASRCGARGTLMRDAARPHNSESLSRLSRLPASIFDEVIPRLVSIGWLTLETLESEIVTAIPHVAAVSPHIPAPRARAQNGIERNGKERKGKEPRGKTRRTYCFEDLPECPFWLNAEAWRQWADYREEKHDPLTPSTALAQFRKLDKLRARGQSPEDILEESISNGWKGLFPLDKSSGNGKPSNIDIGRQALERMQEREAQGNA